MLSSVYKGGTKYSWPLNNLGVQGADFLCSCKSLYNVWLLQNLNTNSLLLTGTLTDNINHQHSLCYMYYLVYLTIKQGREKKMCLQITAQLHNFFQYVYWKKFMDSHSCKSMLFKDQLKCDSEPQHRKYRNYYQNQGEKNIFYYVFTICQYYKV